MDIIKKITDKFGEKFGFVEPGESKTEEIMEKREDIKLTIAVKLYQIGCSDEEIENVLNIIKTAEDEIQVIKDSLIGTNINPTGDPMKPLADGREKIANRYKQMQIELQTAINELLELHRS